MTEAEIASANTFAVEITITEMRDNRSINGFDGGVTATYPSVTCDEANYGMLKDGLDELSATIATEAKAEIDELEALADSAAADGYPIAETPYSYEQTMEVVRADSTIVSLLTKTYINQGGAHPSVTYKAYNYDAQAGMLYALDEIIQDDQYDGLATRIAENLAANYDHSLFNAYMDLQMNAADGNVDDDAFVAALAADVQAMIDDETITYTVGETGITFYFEAYALAVYAAGTQEVTFLYADTPDLVWDGYTHTPAN